MRKGLRFDGVAVAGIGMVRFGMLQQIPVAHLARDAGLAALHDAGHDAGRRRRGVRRLHPAGLDDRRQGDEGARAHRPAGHPHRERVGHRARGVPRGGVGGVVGSRRRGDGAVLRQVHRHGRRRGPRRRPGLRSTPRSCRPSYFALWAQRRMHERGTTPRALRHDRGEELELRRRLPDGPPPTRPRRHRRGGARLPPGRRAADHDDVLPARRRRGVRDPGPRGPRAGPPARPTASCAPLASALQSESYAPRPHVRRSRRRAVDDDPGHGTASATRRRASAPTTSTSPSATTRS